MRSLIVGVVIALAWPGPAHAREWFAVSLDGAVCEDAQALARETAMHGGQHLFATPQGLVDVIRYLGGVPNTHVVRLGPELAVKVFWRTERGVDVFRMFYSSLRDCRTAVAAAIRDGEVTPPEDLR